MTLVRLVFLTSMAAPAFAYAASPAQCTRTWDERKAAHATGGDDYKTFMVACLSNRMSPTTPQMDRPAGAPGSATARCRDGLYSYSPDPIRACAQHRGVEALLR